MAQVPTGSTFFIASTIAAPETTTALTNASPCVVTAAAHGYSNGDIVFITSGWGRINRSAFRVANKTTDTFELEGSNTSNTTYFPATTGVGTAKKVSTFTQITGVMAPSSSGGDPKTVNYKFVESDVEYSINDGFSATNYSMDLDADQIGTAGYSALKTLTDVQTDTILKIVTRSGSLNLIPCTCALNEAVNMTDGQINKVKVSFNGSSRPVRYAA
ncbi:MAG: phage tail tube protein [Proteobacteria bacterium]|nr:phage tail tube protein [Pseudomonadota bacterium]